MHNYSDTKYSLIITIVNRGFADHVIDAAREVGAKGGTVMYARGTGVHEVEKFLNITIQPEKEMVMTIVRKDKVKETTHAIVKAAGLNTEGRGMAFTLPVTDLVGISSEEDKDDVVEVFEDEIEDEDG